MALFSQRFIERSQRKWPQEKIDALGIVVNRDGCQLMRANGTMKRKDYKELAKIKMRR